MTATTAVPPARPAPALHLDGVGITFGDFTAVEGVDLDVRNGEFVCLLGPSGCGKSTLLSVMAGFVPPSDGVIEMEGHAIKGPCPELGVVFQSSDALFDWLTVSDNIAFGPRMRGVDKARRAEIVEEHLRLVGLAQHADKRPPQLSGGMRQRVQIARVLANEPEIVLMDEPFGALDAQTRTVMQVELDRIWRQRQSTVVFVTHDIDEAIVLADRVVVMTAGPSAGIKSTYQVDLPRPRDVDSPAFVELRHAIREDITAEVAKSLGLPTAGTTGTPEQEVRA
ncbi:ATP-binding cassette domain-containing protein [Nocardioides sp. YIM 123512]|uniref:ATP-binding cassette domain-containing protein n=2 Tax=Nocardioides flavescens TaxID=2691959 RepID=A0A6L7EY98_9ACTN|nr:ATP-binding cassette domain-containing protein [Nocardioides flavescens]